MLWTSIATRALIAEKSDPNDNNLVLKNYEIAIYQLADYASKYRGTRIIANGLR